ncbi:hypothetical protein TNCV_4689581 [Trichonephila clavipes]|nr:hypothetical protein TNCV_4689581 [Trichonephila clavipes]
MKMISGGGRKRVPAPLTCETRREMIAVVQIVCNLRKFNIGSRVGEQIWLDRGSRMSSWVHGNTFSRRCSADRNSDQINCSISPARVTSCPHRGCVRQITEQNKWSWQWLTNDSIHLWHNIVGW